MTTKPPTKKYAENWDKERFRNGKSPDSDKPKPKPPKPKSK
jgi:hypothetical protein